MDIFVIKILGLQINVVFYAGSSLSFVNLPAIIQFSKYLSFVFQMIPALPL